MKRFLFISALLILQLTTLNQLIKANGEFDFSFRPTVTYSPIGERKQVEFLPDGRFYLLGRFEPDSTSYLRVARFFADGRRDTTYSQTDNFRNQNFAVQPDGKVICSSIVVGSGGYTYLRVVRFNTDGSVDPTFYVDTPTSEGIVRSMVVQPDGKLLLAGHFREKIPGALRQFVFRFNSDGTVDHSFNAPDPNLVGQELRLLPSGKILVQTELGPLLRLNSNGTIDPAFTPSAAYYGLAVMSNGKILIRESYDSPVKRLNEDGTIDTTFNPWTSSVNNFTVFSDDRILITTGDTSETLFAELAPNGTLLRRYTLPFGSATASFGSSGRGVVGPNNRVYLLGDMFVGGSSLLFARIQNNFTPTRRKAFDFDGDGLSDIAVYRPSTGVWYIKNSSTGGYTITKFGLDGDKPATGDFDGDGKADICVYRPSNGVWYRLNSSDGSFFAQKFGIAEDVPLPYDYDGDNKDDIGVFRPSTGIWYHLKSSDGTFGAFQFGLNGDKPVIGDYDGDGKADYAVWRPSDSVWYRWSSLNRNVVTESYSYYDGHYGTAADYDGDGRTDVSCFRSLLAQYLFERSGNLGSSIVQWGLPGDVPVPADFDGDRRDDIAIWRPSDGTWWIRNSADNSVRTYQFGLAGDIPIQSAYVH